MTLTGKVALVAGATRGAGRGIAIELGAAGATVYATGRTSRERQSDYGRTSETIEQTAELVTAAGGNGIAIRVDHLVCVLSSSASGRNRAGSTSSSTTSGAAISCSSGTSRSGSTIWKTGCACCGSGSTRT